MNSPIIDVIALSERHRLQEKEAHESTKEALASALAEVEELKDGLSDAISHLNYCGWGRDSWERECAEEIRNKLSILQAKYSL